jgi:hypothetical protein
MSSVIRVVVRFADGKVLKGTTQDFFPSRPRFHLLPADGGPAVEVRPKDLKAVFFVKTLAGHPERKKLRGFMQGPVETAQGKKVAVRFKDGELICGYTLSFTPDRDGFFLTPADVEGNNLRIYVLTAAAAEIKIGAAAEALAQRVLSVPA